jgi:hypothetical protein
VTPSAGSDVVMLDRYAPAEVTVERAVYYWLWGKYAISDDSTETAVTASDAFASFLYTVLIPVGVVPQTIVVEGNRAGGYTGRAGIEGAPHHYDLWIQQEPIERGVPKMKQRD